MRSLQALLGILALIAIAAQPVAVSAHVGSDLDAEGCHSDYRTSSYHCHRGAAAGCSFANRAAMEEAVQSGNLPPRTVPAEGFLSKLWPFGKDNGIADKSEQTALPAPAGAPGQSDGAAPAAAQSPAEQRLKVLQGLYEMGLISRDEYEAKRKAVLDGL
jgi:hypothetical protein